MPNDYSSSLVNNNEPLGALDAIKQLESSGGTNPKARIPNGYGALGDYQLTPALYHDIQLHNQDFQNVPFEQAALDPDLSRKAANAGLDVIEKQLKNLGVKPTWDNIVLGYHSGVGNVKKGNIGPIGKKYLSDFKSLTGT